MSSHDCSSQFQGITFVSSMLRAFQGGRFSEARQRWSPTFSDLMQCINIFDEISTIPRPSITPLRKPPVKHHITHSTIAPVPPFNLKEDTVDFDASSSKSSFVNVASVAAHDHTYCACKPAHELWGLVHVLTTKLEKIEHMRNSHRKISRWDVIFKDNSRPATLSQVKLSVYLG